MIVILVILAVILTGALFGAGSRSHQAEESRLEVSEPPMHYNYPMHPTLSPDGRHYYDGRKWRPISSNPTLGFLMGVALFLCLLFFILQT